LRGESAFWPVFASLSQPLQKDVVVMSEAVFAKPVSVADDRIVPWRARFFTKSEEIITGIGRPMSAEARFIALARVREAFAGLCDATGTLPSSRRKAAPVREAPRPVCSTLTVWPASLRLDQAAAYCGLSTDTFKAVCPVKAIELTDSSKGHRWLKVRLDEWLLSIDPNTSAAPSIKKFGETINGR
jgi:hypothetical protein